MNDGDARRRAPAEGVGGDRSAWAAASAQEQERWVSALGPLAGFEWIEWASYECAGVGHRLACYRHQRSGARFHLVPGEPTFRCGGDPDPYGELTIRPLLVAHAPLSGREWRALGGSARDDELPVGGVSWLEASARLLAAGLRLPREAEWVYFARAGVAGSYWWGGEEFDPGASWHQANAGGAPRAWSEHSQRRNAFGLVDVTGNVWEWCDDDLDLAMEGSAWQEGDPGKVHRGGSFDTPRRTAALEARAGSDPRATYPDLGVRPVADLPLGAADQAV